ncbi:E3 ubiquitin-protein ligase hrd1 [Cytospora paraplurivora]|uniref:RING-type E3 ubiquitin transferase n=1 Tax=Cytospora paraplurivora TaxID=2898453 RepID=A0AAN9ULV8_9PEZI
MRLAMYAGASAALAATVITSAFYQRANFYSAMVYLSQSNLCLMTLVNIVFLVYGSLMYGLQRLCFGPLRPVEVEQLYEKAWFAVTETCLAMTVFREEVGAFFLVMFTALITGKVWGWIGEGRVEVLEQQPPANPRLFHTRLVVSLLSSIVYNVWLLSYSINTVIAQAKPTMMVMFLFEFAVLALGSIHTGLRYVISLVEARVVKTQTRHRLEQRRREVAEQRAEILRRREAGEIAEGGGEPLPSEDDIDEMDIEVPGWDAKGQWILFLDLFADFLKLSVYTAFFCVLLVFYGLPIHIMRDLFMTTRSFVKRLTALLRYKQALRDMNRYPDATAEDLGREDTCIICREEMRPWDPNAGQMERTRPKKLPCGHILHFGCLKSWLERQQNQAAAADGQAPGAQNAQLNGQAGQAGQQPAAPRAAMRYINLGPIRLGFAQGGQEVAELANRMGVDLNVPNGPAIPIPQANTPTTTPVDLSTMEAVRNRLIEVDQRIQQEVRDIQQGIQSVQAAQQELQLINLMLAELARIRLVNHRLDGTTTAPAGPGSGSHIQLPDLTEQAASAQTSDVPPQPPVHAANPSLGAGRTAAPTEVQNSDAQQPAHVSTADSAHVAAPTPVTPNWGGSAQLFNGGASSGGLPFGLVPSDSSHSASRTREGGENDANGEANNGSGAGEPAGPSGSAAQAPEGHDDNSNTTSSLAKGKAPAATVEDAEDES